jgi:hypothetical protein
MAYRGVWGVSWRGLWEVAYPLLRKCLIVGIVLASFIAVDKWRPLPDNRMVTAILVASFWGVSALWLWVESRVRRRLRNKKPPRKSASSLTKDS